MYDGGLVFVESKCEGFLLKLVVVENYKYCYIIKEFFVFVDVFIIL